MLGVRINGLAYVYIMISFDGEWTCRVFQLLGKDMIWLLHSIRLKGGGLGACAGMLDFVVVVVVASQLSRVKHMHHLAAIC